jgi:hypothetical protein
MNERIINATQLDLEIGIETPDDVLNEYIYVTQHRDRFLRGEISFEDYIDVIADSTVDTDDYLEGVADEILF